MAPLRTPGRAAAKHAGSGLRTVVLDDLAELEHLRADWDSLAVTAGRPYCAPGWTLPWWDHTRPAAGRLTVVAVHRGTTLVGLAPCYLGEDRSGLTTGRILGDAAASFSEPLATAHLRRDVATALAAALGELGVDVLSLSAVPRDSEWPRLLQETWPGLRPHLSLVSTMGAPYIDLSAGGPDAWLAGRSTHFRKHLRRARREFLRRGGRVRRARTPEEALTGLRDLVRLHRERWAARGGSQAIHGSMPVVLEQAAALLGPSRLQVWTAEAAGRTVAAAMFMAAGHELHYWLGGFDEAWGAFSPSVLLIAAAVVHAPESGCRRISLGPGSQPYKHRLATGEETLLWVDLLPRSRRYPYVRLRQAPYRIRRVAANRTPAEVKHRLRAAAHRLRPPASTPDGGRRPSAEPVEEGQHGLPLE